jgi:hypothetical protein
LNSSLSRILSASPKQSKFSQSKFSLLKSSAVTAFVLIGFLGCIQASVLLALLADKLRILDSLKSLWRSFEESEKRNLLQTRALRVLKAKSKSPQS